MLKLPDFVAVDLETTGLDFEKDEIIEVALVRFVDSKPTESVDFLVKPTEAVLRPFIESLTGISKAELENSEDFASVAGKICSFVGDLPLVAHNATFDSKFLKRTLAKVGVPYDDHVFWDSLTLSRIAYQDMPNHRLDTLVQALGIERSRAHRALPDADACGRLFVMAYEKISQMDPWLMDAIIRVSAGSDMEKLFGTVDEKTKLAPPAYKLPEVEQSSGKLPCMAVPRVSEFFKENGFLSLGMEGFKPRETQTEFATAVERNMHKGGLCVMEAPTGSGKTLAYLVSAANKAASGERVIISTATRALQEQLWNHDIPQLVSVFNGFLKPALLKGRDNYICLRKFEEVLQSSANLLLPEEIDSFMTLIPWIVNTETGDVNECRAFNHTRNHVLWTKVASSAASCQGENCPHFKKCPALCAKRRAMAANMVLVNHSLFLADLSLDFALLPTYEHIVFDEAHRLPECSNQAFGRSISFFSFRNVAKTLVPSRGKRDGLIAELESRLPEGSEHRQACEQLILDIAETEKALHRFFMKMGKKIQKNKGGKGSLVYAKGILAEYDTDPKGVLDQFANMKEHADALFAALAGEESCRGLVKDACGCVDELVRFIQDFEFLVKAGRSDWVFYLEEPFNPHTLKMHAYPLHSGSVWRTKFYPWIKSATFTSATLAVQGDLGYFAKRMGMGSLTGGKRPFMRVFAEQVPQESRRKIMVTRYLPKPSDPTYADALNECLVNVLPNVEENTLVLFTNIAQMMKAQSVLAPAFAEKNKLLLCQYIDGTVDGLVSIFRSSRGACLLGCQSLWEGVDFPGDALKLLVIAKLPFPNPSDPLVAGISAEMKTRGENTFKEYFVPEAYMEMRQGLGRLLRSEEDSGKVLILDNRIVKETYGKTFARIWNFKHSQANSVSDILEFVK